jgi:hypothetical protein
LSLLHILYTFNELDDVMTEDGTSIWKDCNCMNCRLARIENNLKEIKGIIDGLPTELEISPKEAGS